MGELEHSTALGGYGGTARDVVISTIIKLERIVMTRDESKKLTKEKISRAKTGKEIAEAIIAHFKEFVPVGYVPVADYSVEDYSNTPMFGSKI